MLVMVVFFIAFRWIHLSTPLIRLFLLVLILLLMQTLNFLPFCFAFILLPILLPSPLPYMLFPSLYLLPVWVDLSLMWFRRPSRLPMMFILWMVAMMVVIIPSRTV